MPFVWVTAVAVAPEALSAGPAACGLLDLHALLSFRAEALLVAASL